MFGFFKDKLKKVVESFSEKVEEEVQEEEKFEQLAKEAEKDQEKEREEVKEELKEEAEEIIEPEKQAPAPAEVAKAEPAVQPKEAKKPEEQKAAEEEPEVEPKEEPKSGFLSSIGQRIIHKGAERFTKKTIDEEKFDSLFWELELMLLENNVAVEVIDQIKSDLKKDLIGVPLPRGAIRQKITESLGDSIRGLFDVEDFDLVSKAKEKKPFVIAFVGINGSGKTTTIAKVAKLFIDNGLRPVVAASDTFRAAAIQQLEEHCNKLGIRLIKHDYGSDPAAVAFDAVKYAESHGLDDVLIDTAGRLHSNTNLIDEMKKIVRVSNPDLKLFVGESITGNDCIEQANQFNDAIGIDGIILTKADVDEKGGAAISVSYVTKKPILFLGVGQQYSDLEAFQSENLVRQLGLAS